MGFRLRVPHFLWDMGCMMILSLSCGRYGSVIGQCYGQSLPVQESRVVESVGCGGCYSCENQLGGAAEGSGRVQRLFGLVQLIPIFGTGE